MNAVAGTIIELEKKFTLKTVPSKK